MQAFHARPAGQTGHGKDLLAASESRAQDGAAIDRPAVDNHRACATLGAIAAEVRRGQSELLGDRFPQALAHIDGDVTLQTVDVERDAAHRGG